MKKLLIIIFFCNIAFSLVSLEFDSDFECNGECCVEDTTYFSSAYIKNTGDQTVSISRIAQYSETYGIFGQQETREELQQGEDFRITLTGIFPPPDDTNKLLFKTCAYITVFYQDGSRQEGWLCNDESEEKKVTKKQEFQCFTDSNCAENEYCYQQSCTSECKVIEESAQCGQFVDHKWVEYECCENTDCKEDQKCSNNFCIDISCECGYIQNNQCVSYECCGDNDCKTGYYCTNNECKEYECIRNSDCKEDEQCNNNSCTKLDCKNCEYILDNQCIQYECCNNQDCENNEQCSENQCEEIRCQYGQYASNHKCVQQECLVSNDCNQNQYCENNVCKGLECNENQIIRSHECKNLEISEAIIGYPKQGKYVQFLSIEGIIDFWFVYISLSIIILVKFFQKKPVEPKQEEHTK